MDLNYKKLSQENVAKALEALGTWMVEDGALCKKFEFGTYKEGVLFANVVAFAAETLNHHPDLLIGYKFVLVSLRTHDAGGGLTSYDFELARRIEAMQLAASS